MFKLIKLRDDVYSLIGPGLSKEGSKHFIIRTMLSLGVPDQDIEHGLEGVETYHFSDYGINRTYIFSGDFQLKKVS